jgi:hypothetical protein
MPRRVFQPQLQFGFGLFQRGAVEEAAEQGDVDGAGAEVEGGAALASRIGLVDAEFFVKLLQPVLHAAQRQVAAGSDGAVGQAEGDVLQHFVFAVAQPGQLIVGLQLNAANLAVDHALLLDEQPPQGQTQALFRGGFEDVTVSGPLGHDPRDAAHIGLVRVI